jgi:O-antigen/teichoic acid export membrane protein
MSVSIVALIILAGTPFIRFFFKEIQVPIVFTSLIAAVCVTQSIQYVGSNMLKWTFQSPLFAKITLSHTLVSATLTIGGIILFGWRAKEVLLVVASVALGAGIWANLCIRQYIKVASVSRKRLKELVAYSWPLLGLNVFAFFTRSLGRVFLASLASLGAVGIFSVSSTVASVFDVIVSGFFFAWGPYVLSTFHEKWAPARYAQFFSVTSWFGLMSLIGLGLWGSPIVMLVRPDGSYQAIGVFIPWIVSGSLLYYLGGYFTPGPSITKQTYWKFMGFLLAGTMNAVLNYLLIPTLGVLGTCLAMTMSSLVAGIFNQVVSNRLFFVPNRWKLSFTLIVLLTAMISFIQSNRCPYSMSGISLMGRFLVTLILMSAATLPFYGDIKASGIIHQAVKVMRKWR